MDGARWGPPGWLCWAAASAASTLQHLQRLAAPVQLNLGGGRGATQAHYGPGETVFNEGDTGDSLFMIISDRVEVLKRFGGSHGWSASSGRVSTSERWRCSGDVHAAPALGR